MTKPIFLIFSVVFWLSPKNFAQKQDSLSQKPYSFFIKKLNSYEFDKDNPEVWVYITAFLDKAKREGELKHQFSGYMEASYYSFEKESELIYIDSMLSVAERMPDKEDRLALAYSLKGTVYYSFRDYTNTLKYYLKSHDLLEHSSNQDLINDNLYGIGVVKLYLGYYEEAKELFEQTAAYFKNSENASYKLMYLRSLFRLSELHQATKEFDQAKHYNLLGLQKSNEYKEHHQENFFNIQIGVNDYYEHNYTSAIANLEKGIKSAQESRYFEMEQKAHYYLAKSYLGLKQENQALSHFQQLDSISLAHDFLDPNYRDSYEWLLAYYSEKKDKQQELYFVKRLLAIDEANRNYEKSLAYEIHKEFDTKKLLKLNDALEGKLVFWQKSGYIYLGVSVLVLCMGLLFYNTQLKKWKRKFNEIIVTQVQPQQPIQEPLPQIAIAENNSSKGQKIPDEVVEFLLNRLNKFEKENEFLDKKIDLGYLAKKFKTNTNYLSKVINHSKGLNFTQYISQLRVNYLIHLLKSEPDYRQLTIEALADHCGFTSARQLSESFKQETGLSPSYFLEHIKREGEKVFA